MGLSVSIDYNKVPPDWLEVFKKMKFSRAEIKKIHDIFDRLDEKQKGGINIVEWLTFLDLDRNPFTERVFCAFDKDGNKTIDFYEFVVAVWKFCTLGDGSINIFAFDLYDKNSDGVLETKEVHQMFRELLGNKLYEAEANQVAMKELMSLTETGRVCMDDFRSFARRHQGLLKQVFHMQSRLRMEVLGDAFWRGFSARRIELRKGYNVEISSLMTLHADRDLFRNLMEDRTIMRISSKMKIVLENTDNALHHQPDYQRSTSTVSVSASRSTKASADAAAKIILSQAKPQVVKRVPKKKKVHPVPGGSPASPRDLMHYHRFPY